MKDATVNPLRRLEGARGLLRRVHSAGQLDGATRADKGAGSPVIRSGESVSASEIFGHDRCR